MEELVKSDIKDLYNRAQRLASDTNAKVQSYDGLGNLIYGSDEYETRQNLNMAYSYLKSALRYLGYARSIKEF